MGGPIVITGGGTGGHIFPMQAIAERLMSRGVASSEIRYVGSRRGQEATLLAGGEIALTLLPGRGIRRSLLPRAWRDNLGAVVALLGAVVTAQYLIGRWRPRVVVSVGGYASFAVSFAAVLWRIPLVLVELDAAPGAALRFLRRFATKRCRAFASDDLDTVFTGAPVRGAIAALDRSPAARVAARAAADPPIDPGRQVVVVMTGSLGSTRVNTAVSDLAQRWAARSDRTIIHVTGRRDYDQVRATRPIMSGLDYRVLEFGDMATLWALCDVAVCRAGSATMAELAVLAIPAVLVPLPGMGDHQARNARDVVRAGGARLIEDARCDGESLGRALDEIMTPETLNVMSQVIGKFGRIDAAGAIATVVCEAGGC
ncbi:MAG TPA: UDP-N-acetylglucosamine--N-acetylmuramyl-(pentapeptide) pyrophosphoryl-undecaprenol N-acetylglucosamine transferase [Acidimicrobiales bacterium]|nr:UDP-N-acetylglucosamine--N-acetylmuramyl-(pentapeptide) pyrophosphoryl-undecaprenol N-acetylglucosamine transferase [Acidimicrobiales bacterium]